MGNGIQDEMIPIAFAQKTKDQLIELDVKVDYNDIMLLTLLQTTVYMIL